MQIGLALPQYDYATTGALPAWEPTVATAQQAEAAGFDAVFLADHLFMSIEKYGGPPGRHPGFDPVVGLAAIAAATSRVRVGSLVINVAMRPPRWLAKNLAGIDVLSDGRLIAGVGAGWLEAEFEQAGVPFLPAPARLAALEAAIAEVKATWHGEGPPLGPAPATRSGPPLWVGAKGDRAIGVAARAGDGWNTVWRWTPAQYRDRLEVFEAACGRAGRDPSPIVRSVGLTTLVGEDEADVAKRFDAMAAAAPAGVVTEPLEVWREGRLVGTPAQVKDQLEVWRELGVAMVIADLGALPFSVDINDALAPCAAALIEPALTEES